MGSHNKNLQKESSGVMAPQSSVLNDAHFNIQVFKNQIQNKLNEINPIIGFYDAIILGWNKRLTLAEYLLNREEDPNAKSNLKELLSIAKIEVERIKEATRDVAGMQVLLRDKMQDLNMLALRQSSAVDFNANLEIDDFKKVLYAADALLELRQQIVKEITI